MNNQQSFDDILSNRIGLGKYQYLVITIIGLINFVDGSKSLYLSMLPTLIYKEWNLDSQLITLLISIYYIGVFIGTLISGLANDNFGRRVILNYGLFMELLLICLLYFTSNIVEMLLVRFLQGFAYGFVLPISLIYITEFSTKNVRGRAAITLQLFFLLGKVYLLILCSFFIQSLSQGDWRSIAIYNAIPMLLILILSVFILDESPRFLISNGKFQEAIEIINKMGYRNHGENKFEVLNNFEIEQLTNWQKSNFKEQITNKDRFFGLFTEQQLPITWRLQLISLSIFILISGETFLTTFIFDKNGAGLGQYSITFIAELPAIIMGFLMIDTKQFGRKVSTFIAQLSLVVLMLIMYFGREVTLLICVTIFKGFIRFNYIIFSPMVAESYNTMIRSFGIGFTYGIGRIGAGISPFILYPLFLIDIYLPYLAQAILVIVVFFGATITYPIDLTQKALDLSYKEQYQNNEKQQEEEEKDQLLKQHDDQQN